MRRRALLLAAAAWPAAHAADPGVELTGAVRQPLTLDAEALARYPSAAQSTLEFARSVDGTERRTRLAGVRLTAVLEQAGLAERDRLDWRKAVVLATATDGYRAVFSWPELFNTEAGGQVLLVWRRDDAPLDAREGPIALHAPGDLKTGPRHVRQLMRLEVRILRD